MVSRLKLWARSSRMARLRSSVAGGVTGAEQRNDSGALEGTRQFGVTGSASLSQGPDGVDLHSGPLTGHAGQRLAGAEYAKIIS